MKVHSLFIQPEKHGRFVEVKSIETKEHFGLVNDCHAHVLSPRQILITSLESINYLGIKPGDLHENIVLSDCPVEQIPSGSVITCGSIKIRVTFPCEPCSFINTLNLKTPASIISRRGMLGIILNSGILSVGDKVATFDSIYPPIPDKLAKRIIWLADKIPYGKILSYRDIIIITGAPQSTVRAFPAILKKSKNEHRIVNSRFELVKHCINQEALLLGEGVLSNSNYVDPSYTWDSYDLYYTK